MLYGRGLVGCVALSLALSSTGCSFLFVTPPSSPEPGTISTGGEKCTTSKVAPVLDTIFTGLEAARIVYAAAAPDSVYSDPKQPLSRGADIALGVGFAALFLGSAVYGYVNTAKCSELRKPGAATVHREADRDNDWSKPPEATEKWGGDQSAAPPAPATEAPSAAP